MGNCAIEDMSIITVINYVEHSVEMLYCDENAAGYLYVHFLTYLRKNNGLQSHQLLNSVTHKISQQHLLRDHHPFGL